MVLVSTVILSILLQSMFSLMLSINSLIILLSFIICIILFIFDEFNTKNEIKSEKIPHKSFSEALEKLTNKEANPQVITLFGGVGVGKTTYLKKTMKSFHNAIYISLFNKSSLDHLKSSLINAYYSDNTTKYYKRLFMLIKNNPITKPYITSIKDIFISSNIKSNTVIIDDLDRFQEHVSFTIPMLMGYICQLRDENKCTVILVYGGKIRTHEIYNNFIDKVVDREIEFEEVSIDEVCNNINSDVVKESFKKQITKLNINNLRTIEKMISFYNDVFSDIIDKKFLNNKEYIAEFIHYYSLFFFCNQHYNETEIPTLDYILNSYMEDDYNINKKKEIITQKTTDEELKRIIESREIKNHEYHSFLKHYKYKSRGFGDCSLLAEISKIIEKGYIDREDIFIEYLTFHIDDYFKINDCYSKWLSLTSYFTRNFSDENDFKKLFSNFMKSYETAILKGVLPLNTVHINEIYLLIKHSGNSTENEYFYETMRDIIYNYHKSHRVPIVNEYYEPILKDKIDTLKINKKTQQLGIIDFYKHKINRMIWQDEHNLYLAKKHPLNLEYNSEEYRRLFHHPDISKCNSFLNFLKYIYIGNEVYFNDTIKPVLEELIQTNDNMIAAKVEYINKELIKNHDTIMM